MYKYAIIIVAIIWSGLAFGQENKPKKKVVLIEKSNKNGEVTENRREAEGDEAEALIRELEADGDIKIDETNDGKKKVISITKSISKEVKDGESDNIDGKIEKFKIIKMEDGKEKVLEWDGKGEMPEELAKEMKNININKQIDGDNMTITIDADDETPKHRDHEQVIIMRGDEKEPNGHKKPLMWKEKGKEKMSFPEKGKKMKFSENKPANKATLGVMIDDTDQGVVISDIVDGSAAAKAGLRIGDTILKINKTYIFTSSGLLDALRPFNPNEKVKVSYIRDGKEKCTKAVLNGK